MLGPFATASRLTSIHQVSLAVLSRAACASMSTTTTTTRDRGDRYGPIEWAQQQRLVKASSTTAHGTNTLLANSSTIGLVIDVGASKTCVGSPAVSVILSLCACVCLSVCQGRRSLWDRGDTSPPIFMKGGHPW